MPSSKYQEIFMSGLSPSAEFWGRWVRQLETLIPAVQQIASGSTRLCRCWRELHRTSSTTLNQGCTSMMGAPGSQGVLPHHTSWLLGTGKSAFCLTSCWFSNLELLMATKLTLGKYPAAGSDLTKVQRRAGRMDTDWFHYVTSLFKVLD